MESVLAFVIGVAVIVVGLALSIGLHEIGHLVPAKLFKVKVAKVRTVMVKGKPKRVRMNWGRTADFKKAIVTLAEGQRIDVM